MEGWGLPWTTPSVGKGLDGMTPIQSIAAIIGHEPEPSDMLDDLGLDLIDLWRVRDDLERAHNIEISCDAMMRWVTVEDVMAALEKNLQAVHFLACQ